MADETDDNLGPLLEDLAKYGVGTAGTLGANASTQAAYQAIIKNLRDRFGDYNNLKLGITPAKLGPSALDGIQGDPQARADEQAAIAQLDDIAKSGGLTLSDMTALNRMEQSLSRNASARNASIADQFAARGQLGSGRQMQMQLAGAQNATESANQRGEGIAAQAQQRAMDAILKKGTASHALSAEDYARKKAAADAADSISKYNASMETDAQKFNDDVQLRKLAGETGLTDSLNNALLGSGKQQANTTAGLAYGGAGLVAGLGGAAKGLSKLGSGSKGGGGGGGGSNDPGLDASGQADEAGNTGGAADLTGGDKGDINAEPGTNYGGSDPSDWEQWNGGA